MNFSVLVEVLAFLFVFGMVVAELICRALFYREPTRTLIVNALIESLKTLFIVSVFVFVIFSVFYISQFLTLILIASE